MTKKYTMLDTIIEELSVLDIAGYLKEEIESLFKNLHYYKLQNIHQNIDALKEYLHFLDHHSTQQIHALEYIENAEIPEGDHDILYYVSQKGLELVGSQKIRQKIWEDHYSLSYIMQAVKGFLLLTADEFCNASPTRMSINRMLRKKQLVTTK
ncbi:hypothetical protein P148_SR1C00001G0229 [candidate division SR1 bacterium RAAC1_SR1_1]|nr:hypothetical protein P148_SR1C00001G0229 [candidate division SR1 bacterium RAAC1_SR1_1]